MSLDDDEVDERSLALVAVVECESDDGVKGLQRAEDSGRPSSSSSQSLS